MSRTHMLAWAAGFFDGEGYITIQRRNTKAKSGKRYFGHYLRVGLKHVAPAPIYELQKLFGGTIKVEVRKSNKDGYNRKAIHVWSLSCNQAVEALKQMMPYFLNKNKVAELAFKFQATMQDNKLELPLEIVLQREQIKEELFKLNSAD